MDAAARGALQSGGCARFGRREPIARTAELFPIVPAFPNDIELLGGSSPVENGIPADVSASRNTLVSGALLSGTTIPHTTAVGNERASKVNFQFEVCSISENCTASATASGSFAGHTKTTFPSTDRNAAVNKAACCGWSWRHAVDFIICAVSSRAASASFSSRAARSSALAALAFAFAISALDASASAESRAVSLFKLATFSSDALWIASVNSYPTYPAVNAANAVMTPAATAIHRENLTTNSQAENDHPHNIYINLSATIGVGVVRVLLGIAMLYL